MYRKRFTNRTSQRKHDRLDREAEALRADRAWYPRVDPLNCTHGLTWIPDMAYGATGGMRVCEDCGVQTDSQHNVIGKGYRDSMTEEALANVQRLQQDRIAAHRAMLDACSVTPDSGISED